MPVARPICFKVVNINAIGFMLSMVRNSFVPLSLGQTEMLLRWSDSSTMLPFYNKVSSLNHSTQGGYPPPESSLFHLATSKQKHHNRDNPMLSKHAASASHPPTPFHPMLPP